MTLAQLGLPETFTPARFRFPTRMFPAQKEGEYEPYRIRERRHEVKVSNGNGAPKEAPKEDVEMKDAESAGQDGVNKAEGQGADGAEKTEEKTQTIEEVLYEEDVTTEEGAVYPIQDGRIVDWPCFFALLTHIYNALSPPFHTPILMIAQPVWSARDRETITQFIFEKFKVPGFSLMDSALAACYGYGVQTATVIDVGKGKVDVTAVTDFAVNEHGRGIALQGCGGDAMTDRLLELLGPKRFTREMCEQLKRSNITEIVPPGTPLPGAAATARQGANPATAASTGADGNDAGPRGPGEGTQTGTETNGDEDEGVLDVAAIVSGNTTEYLANMEKDKSAKKGGAADPRSKLPNNKKEKATFQFEEFVPMEEESAASGSKRYMRHNREIEVGVERFLLTSPSQQVGDRLSSGILEDIATQIHHTILAVPDATKRSELWDSLIIVGCGSKVRGKSIFLTTLNAWLTFLQALPRLSLASLPKSSSSLHLPPSSHLKSPPPSPPLSRPAVPTLPLLCRASLDRCTTPPRTA
jgi:actin-related protein 9